MRIASCGVEAGATPLQCSRQTKQVASRAERKASCVYMKAVRGKDIQQKGYSDGSPYRKRKSITISGDTIDMSNTGIKLRLIPDVGEEKVAEPYSGIHKFPGATQVKEIPIG